MERRKTRPGEAARIALHQAIALRFKRFGDFSDALSADISTGGMFVRAPSPHPVGSVFEFELRLSDEAPPIAGKAQVAWVRRRSDNADEPIGMGVRFVELADDSRRQIARLVAGPEAGGGPVVEVEAAPPQAAAGAGVDRDRCPQRRRGAGHGRPRQENGRQRSDQRQSNRQRNVHRRNVQQRSARRQIARPRGTQRPPPGHRQLSCRTQPRPRIRRSLPHHQWQTAPSGGRCGPCGSCW